MGVLPQLAPAADRDCAGTLIQRVRDLGGWIIGCVGLVFFLAENLGMEIWKIVISCFPFF